MSEITPNTPNPVREDAYVEELSEKLGIEPQYIPKSPVWRNEEEIKAIAEMFANMSGGSSGGGALKVGVNVTESGNKTIYTLDKTWKQISDAIENGTIPYVVDNESGSVNTLTVISSYEQNGAMVYSVELGQTYETDSENGYPYLSGAGGWS